jgi:hypothetical protein
MRKNGLKMVGLLCRLIEICKLTRVQKMALNISPFTPRQTDVSLNQNCELTGRVELGFILLNNSLTVLVNVQP